MSESDSVTKRQRSSRGEGNQLREEIIGAAIALVLESKELRAPSIRDVAREIGVTPPSIYLHFADKDQLMDAACGQYYQQLDDEMVAAAVDQRTALERLHAQGMAYVRFATATPLMYRLATSAPPRNDSELDETLVSAAFAHLHKGVLELVAEGFYPDGDTVAMGLQLWTAAHGVASMLVTKPYLPWGDAELFADNALRVACLGQAVSDIDLSGLLPRQK
ncbi:AcrR family transcriptional regulator [Mycobacteroides chelonae]|nr:AcrR family transcriptional regulator [Mycobacteroides chelonae]